jgi:hypothetical protein
MKTNKIKLWYIILFLIYPLISIIFYQEPTPQLLYGPPGLERKHNLMETILRFILSPIVVTILIAIGIIIVIKKKKQPR